MEYRQLGASGLFVPVLSFGTATFGGTNGFEAWGNTQTKDATRMINLCLDAGVNHFDTSDVYSQGLSEEILGKALTGLRDKALPKQHFLLATILTDAALLASTCLKRAKIA